MALQTAIEFTQLLPIRPIGLCTAVCTEGDARSLVLGYNSSLTWQSTESNIEHDVTRSRILYVAGMTCVARVCH